MPETEGLNLPFCVEKRVKWACMLQGLKENKTQAAIFGGYKPPIFAPDILDDK